MFRVDVEKGASYRIDVLNGKTPVDLLREGIDITVRIYDRRSGANVRTLSNGDGVEYSDDGSATVSFPELDGWLEYRLFLRIPDEGEDEYLWGDLT